MKTVRTVRELCAPHDDLQDLSLSDTVLDISHLNQEPLPRALEPDYFFERNVFTRAGRSLALQAFNRLASGSGDGVFLLSDGMGGGKTHSILSLGLLARHPAVRARELAEAAHPKLGVVRVATFDGRNSNRILAEEIGRQLDVLPRFAPFLQPLKPIGKDEWGSLLGDLGPLIIAIDELPPYLDAAEATPVGSSNLARITATSISNLIRGISAGGNLANVVLVLTDLAATAYENSKGAWLSIGSTETLDNLRQEVDQVAVRLQPVDNQGMVELYEILRRRCFKKIPAVTEVRKIAEARRGLLLDADADWGTEQVNTYLSSVTASYPFDPHLSEILYRTKDERGFQSTRRLLRLMQSLVGDIFTPNSSLADIELIGPQHLSPAIPAVLAQILNVKPRLEAPILQGIADGGRSAAEQLDRASKQPNAHVAERVATLILWGSLANSGAKPGVTEDELITICIDGQTSADQIEEALGGLVESCHYLYRIEETNAARFLFRDTENVRAAIAKRADELAPEKWRSLLRARLEEYLKPSDGSIYSECLVFPTYDRLRLATERRTLLVLFPDADGSAEARARAWWQGEDLKNQVLFIYADHTQLESIERTARRLEATHVYERELRNAGVLESSAQISELRAARAADASNFYQAVTGAYRKLLFPNRADLQSRDIERRDGSGHEFGKGVDAPLEGFVAASVRAAKKFQDEHGYGSEFEDRISTQVMSSGAIGESELRRAIASTAAIPWSSRDALADLIKEMLAAGRWRKNGTMYEPVKKDERMIARIIEPVETVVHDDSVDLVVRVENADGIEIRYLDASGKERKVQEKTAPGVAKTIRAEASVITLQATSSTKIPQAAPVEVMVPVVILAEIRRRGVAPYLYARTVPAAELRVTFDGIDPVRGKSFTAEIDIPERTSIVRVAAVAGNTKLSEKAIKVESGPTLSGPCRLSGVTASDRLSLEQLLEAASREGGRFQSLMISARHTDGSKARLEHEPRDDAWLSAEDVRRLRAAVDLAATHKNEEVAAVLEVAMRVGFPSGAALRRFCEATGQTLDEQRIDPLGTESFS